MEHTRHILLGLAGIVVLGIGSQCLAWRLRLPSILVLLLVGFTAGPATGLLRPEDLLGDLLFPVVSLSVAVILFEGGLSLRLGELREIAGVLRNLLTLGALTTWILSATGAYYLLGFDVGTALLLGAILVVTGPTVVGPLLRHVRPVGKVSSVAKWEGIIIDPIGAILAVLVYSTIESIGAASMGEATGKAVLALLLTVASGATVGLAAAVPVTTALRRHWIPDFLQSPMLLMAVVAAFTVSNLMREESGLIAVTLMGVMLANQQSVSVRHIIEFKENLRVLLISTLFILLAANLTREAVLSLGWTSVLFLLYLMVVVRPAAVFLSTLGSALTWQERVFLSWLAPRGIVAASVASVFQLELGAGGAGLVPATFLVIVGTVTVYGLSAPRLATWLGLATPNPQGVLIASAHPGARAIAHALHDAGIQVLLVDSNRGNAAVARLEGLPTEYASILSEHALEQMDFGGLGRLLALTPNEEVNTLAALHFSEVFGRAGVYQLAPQRSGRARTEVASHHLRGRVLFGPEVTYDYLDHRFEAGGVVKRTRLTEEFGYEDFRKTYGDQAVPLFVLDGLGQLAVCTADRELKFQPGHTLIALVDPPGEAAGSPATLGSSE